ncbi:MAG: pyruvate kinase [Candidatus Woesearchaeota archaeon]
MRKTKIVATVGPSSFDLDVLKKLSDLDVNCFRINTAHGDFDQYESIINKIRDVSDAPIMIDIKGPEIRIRLSQDLNILKNTTHTFDFKKGDLPYFSYNFYKEISIGDRVFFDNGNLYGKITKKEEGKIKIKFFDDYILKQNKGVNIPNASLKIPSLSKKDVEAVEFALNHNIEYIALSFVRSKQDILDLKELIGELDVGIISKIENWEGVKNIDEIIDNSDGIMVARGDLGIELEEEKIPLIQKEIITKTNQKAKISIVATQMLESMVENKTPTRAEISDVANAILDGADAIMLSGETAAGKYPVHSVKVMDKVAVEVENKVKPTIDFNIPGDLSEELSKSAYDLMFRIKADKLVTITRSGYSARLISRFRFRNPVISVTDDSLTHRKSKLVWGVKSVLVDTVPVSAMITMVSLDLLEKKEIKESDNIVFFAGVKTNQEQVSNLVEVHGIKDLMDYHKKVSKK